MYELAHKIFINLSIIDNLDLLPMVGNSSTKYSASQLHKISSVKYFYNGIILMNANDFINKYRDHSKYKPKSNWVILLSLSTDIDPNNNEIIRYRNRTSLVCSCNIDSIREGSQSWPDPGLALDPKQIQYKSTLVEFKDGTVVIRGSVPQGMSFKETPYDFIRVLNKSLEPFRKGMQDYRMLTSADPYENEEGENLIYDTYRSINNLTNIFSPTAHRVRERLVKLFQNQEDPYAYIVKGVAFTSQREYELRMQMIRFGLPDGTDETLVEMYALRYERDKPITEHLLNEYPISAEDRLKHMTREQVEWLPRLYSPSVYCDFTLGLTDAEYTEMSKKTKELRDPEERQAIYEHYRDLIVERWKEVHSNT